MIYADESIVLCVFYVYYIKIYGSLLQCHEQWSIAIKRILFRFLSEDDFLEEFYVYVNADKDSNSSGLLRVTYPNSAQE